MPTRPQRYLHTSMPSAEFHTDYRPVRCKLNLHFKPKPKRGPTRKKLQVGGLRSDEQLMRELLFASISVLFAKDDALVAHTETVLLRRGIQALWSQSQPKEGSSPARPTHISVGETELKAVQHFTYLGCNIIIPCDATIDKEVDSSLAEANSPFGPYSTVVCGTKST